MDFMQCCLFLHFIQVKANVPSRKFLSCLYSEVSVLSSLNVPEHSNRPCIALKINSIFEKLHTYMYFVFCTGMAAFLPKYLEYQFGLTSSQAAMLVGAIIVPAGAGGTLLGGYLVT
jgi:hypothetical protein